MLWAAITPQLFSSSYKTPEPKTTSSNKTIWSEHTIAYNLPLIALQIKRIKRINTSLGQNLPHFSSLGVHARSRTHSTNRSVTLLVQIRYKLEAQLQCKNKASLSLQMYAMEKKKKRMNSFN